MEVTFDNMLEAGVHFGHLTRKWNPAMKPYIFGKSNDIHIIDLIKTQRMLEDASRAAKQLALTGRRVLYVGTKKQAKEILERHAQSVGMPYVTDRWLGGMLTNFTTVRKSIKRMQQIEKMELDGTFDMLQKKERLMLEREKTKLKKELGGIADLNRLPAALFIVDIMKEHLAIKEAKRLNIPTIAIVDTNSDPNQVDFPIPANDDAAASIDMIVGVITGAIKEGLEERKTQREQELVQQARDAEASAEGKDADDTSTEEASDSAE